MMSYVLNTSCQAGVSALQSLVEVREREEGTTRLCFHFRWWQFSPPRNYPAPLVRPLFHRPSRPCRATGCCSQTQEPEEKGVSLRATEWEGLPSSREALIGPGSCHVRRWAVPVERWGHRRRGPFTRTRWRSSGL